MGYLSSRSQNCAQLHCPGIWGEWGWEKSSEWFLCGKAQFANYFLQQCREELLFEQVTTVLMYYSRDLILSCRYQA